MSDFVESEQRQGLSNAVEEQAIFHRVQAGQNVRHIAGSNSLFQQKFSGNLMQTIHMASDCLQNSSFSNWSRIHAPETISAEQEVSSSHKLNIEAKQQCFTQYHTRQQFIEAQQFTE